MNSHVPYARCLRDYLGGDEEAAFTIEREDGATFPRDAGEFLSEVDARPHIEGPALQACRGRILDVGAGGGPHALWLQARGFEVVALDFCEEVVELLRRRGVRDARCADIHDFTDDEPFDTILILGRTIGLAGDLPGLGRLLTHLRQLCVADGQLLLTSCDVRASRDERMLAQAQRNREQGREPGYQRFRFRYGEILGSWIEWLHVDAGTLAGSADETGWSFEVVADEGNGNYLARLTPNTSVADRARS